MPEPNRRSTPAERARRSLLASLLLSLALVANAVMPAPAAADEPAFGGPAPSPTRDGQAKGSGNASAPEPELTGRLIVRYAEGVGEADRDRVRGALGLTKAAETGLERAEVVTPAANVMQAVSTLAKRAEIEWVQPEQRLRLMAGPTTEPYFGQQWALHNTGQTVGGYPGVPDVDINAPEAWAVTQGSANVVVAVIDDGVDINHPDLAGRIWKNPGEIAGNGLDDDGNGLVDDVNGWDFCRQTGKGDSGVFEPGQAHGTHVAGSIAASGNGVGIAGVAPKVTIMPIRFLDDSKTWCGTETQAAEAIRYAVSKGARIVNASWGGYAPSPLLRDTIANASNTLFVAASGNDNLNTDKSPVSPASLGLPNIISVAAVHNEGFLTDWTNYGPETVDIVAPGEAIVILAPGASPPYAYGDGTSMAAPHVTGVAALAVSAQPSLLGQAAQLRRHLIDTARAMPSVFGWVANPRMVDARAAVTRPDVVRLSGNDRYASAAAMSKATFVPHVPWLFVATGRDFPDALAGGALAAQLSSPVLLVSPSSIPSATLAEIKRLRPVEIFVLGGPAVVSNAVVQQLGAYDAPGSIVQRLAGTNRYATAAAISSAAFVRGVPTAFIATGANFPDALAAAPVSAMLGGPLLLVGGSSVPAATAAELSRLAPKRIVILGGTSVVSGSVASQLSLYTSGTVSRWAGANRYATAATASKATFSASQSAAFVANGGNFPDALAGGPIAGIHGGPMLLVTGSQVPAATAQELQRLRPARIFVLGGPAVVSNAVATTLKGYLR